MESQSPTKSSSLRILINDIPAYSRIELPCFVQSAEKALDCLGGKEPVHEAIKDADNVLHFTYPSTSARKTRVSASMVHKNGLLIRIRRKKSEPTVCSSEVVGTIQNSFIFNNLADYEFLRTSTPASEQLGRTILETVPSSFSRDRVNKGAQRLVLHEGIRKPLSVNRPSASASGTGAAATASSFGPASTSKPPNKPPQPASATKKQQHPPATMEDSALVELETKGIQESNSRNPDKGLAYFINIDDPVPLQHPRGEYPYENERGIVLVRLLKKLFNIIPIMSREQIETYLNLEGRVHLFKSCLPYVAYNLVKGPFRQMWVRYGFDPKEHPSCALYQTIHFRVSPQVVKDVTERVGKKVGSSVSRSKMVDLDALRVTEMPLNSVTYLLLNRPQQDPPIFAYHHVIKMQIVLQIFQLMDPLILEYLKGCRLLPVFDNVTGWFPADTINALRVMALKGLPERIYRFVSLPDSVIWGTGAKATVPAVSVPCNSSSSSSSSGSSGSVGSGSSGSRAFDAASLADMFATAGFNPDEDATQLGFDEHSTGLFVACNRTLNTLRAYFQCAAQAGPETALADAMTPAYEVNFDEVRTVDGLFLGKVLAWHRRFSTVMVGLQTRALTERLSAQLSSPQLLGASASASASASAGASAGKKTTNKVKATPKKATAATKAAATPATPATPGEPLSSLRQSAAASLASLGEVLQQQLAGEVQGFSVFNDDDDYGGESGDSAGTSDSEEYEY